MTMFGKALWVLGALALAGCGRPCGVKTKFQQDDCLLEKQSEPEPWHQAEFRVAEVGQHSYRLEGLHLGQYIIWTVNDRDLEFRDDWKFHRVKCPVVPSSVPSSGVLTVPSGRVWR